MPEPATETPITNDEQIALLVAKHREAIDPILAMNADEQKKAVMAYGIDPKMLEQHYEGLQAHNRRLVQEHHSAGRKALFTAAGFFAATLGGLAWKRISNISLIRWAFIGTVSVFAGFAGNFVGWRVFGGTRIEEDAKDLARSARQLLENELAIAMENKGQEQPAIVPAEAATPEPQAKAPPVTESLLKSQPAQRSKSFAEAAFQEKTAEQATVSR